MRHDSLAKVSPLGSWDGSMNRGQSFAFPESEFLERSVSLPDVPIAGMFFSHTPPGIYYCDSELDDPIDADILRSHIKRKIPLRQRLFGRLRHRLNHGQNKHVVKA